MGVNMKSGFNDGVKGEGLANKVTIWTNEDTITYDSNFHWDSSNNRLGINTSFPASALHIISDETSAQFQRIDNTAFGGAFKVDKGRGTPATVLVVQTDDVLGTFNFRGWTGSAFKAGARFTARVDTGTVSSSSMPGKLIFSTTSVGSISPVDRMIINEEGTIYLGGATDNISIDKNGNMFFNGDSTVWDDLQVNLSSVRLPASGSPTWTAYKGSQVLAFSPTQDNKIYFTAQIPHGYKQDSNIDFHIHIVYPDNNTGNSEWILTHSWANILEDFPTETTVNVSLRASGNADNHTYEDIANIDGTGQKISSVLLCSLERNGTNARDDYANNIYLAALDFHIEKDTVGSRTELSK